MTKTCFLPNVYASALAGVALQASQQEPEQEDIKICIIGSKRSIHTIIQTLHHLGFAEANSWSKPQPTGNAGEYISVLLRQIAFS